MSRRTFAGVAAVAAVATALRFWRLSWGSAEQICFPDEMWWARRVAAFFPLSWSALVPAGHLFYPTLYGSTAGLAAVAAAALGLVPAPLDPARTLDGVLVARVVSATASLGTVAITGALAARAFGARVGLVAAALAAVAPVEVMQVHFASVDPMLVLWMTAALAAAFAIERTGSRAAAAWSGAAVGLATATKYTGAATVAVVGWALVESAWRRRTWGRLAGHGIVMAAVAVLVAVAACPSCALRAGDVARELRVQRTIQSMLGGLNSQLAPSLGWYGRPYLYHLVAGLPFALGWSFYVVALGGVACGVTRLDAGDRLLLAAIVPYFVAVGGYTATYARYLLPLVPPLAVFAARALVDTAMAARPARHTVSAIVAGIVVVHTCAFAGSLVRRLAYDQQVEALRWIGAHGQRVGRRPSIEIPRPYADYSGMPPLLAKARLVPELSEIGSWLEHRPDVFVLPEWMAVYLRRTPPSPAAPAQLERLQSGAAGYREAARWEPAWFLDEPLYAWLDPGFRTEWSGRIGLRIYVPAPPPD